MAGNNRSTTRPAVIAAVVGALAVVLGVGFIGCRRPPQMGADEETFKAVDALFTAVTARDEKLLGQCEQRLHGLRAAGKLPDGAADFLDGVIGKARGGRWEAAAEKLYGFMQGQRREGATGHAAKKEDRGQRPVKRGSGANSPGAK